MKIINSMRTVFESRSINEAYGRTAVTAFLAALDPTVDEIADIKTAVSEAVTNAIIHGYEENAAFTVYVSCILYKCGQGYLLQVVVEDTGKGIENIKQAMEPMYTTRPDEERTGMGFAFMEAFMDDVQVESEPMKGTAVTLTKKIGHCEEFAHEG